MDDNFEHWRLQHKFRSLEQEQSVLSFLKKSQSLEFGSEEEFGDFQTPLWFTEQVCRYLKDKQDIEPTVLIEPTYGRGHFISSGATVFPQIHTFYGVELQEKYETYGMSQFIQKGIRPENIHLHLESVLEHAITIPDLSKGDQILVIGNPPWVTNSRLSAIQSSNLPVKANFKQVKGLDARLGKSNFDISESIILRLISWMQGRNGHIVMVCKDSIVSSLLKESNRNHWGMEKAEQFQFDAKKVFKIACDACLLILHFNGSKKPIEECIVYDFETGEKVRTVRLNGGRGVQHAELYEEVREYDGACPFEWRQGIKHDCSKVMELSKQSDGQLKNGYGELISFSSSYIYPLLKSSDLKGQQLPSRKMVIVPQQKIGEETDSIQNKDPSLWTYLQSYQEDLHKRKSKIYEGRPFASVFGIGEYSFMPYKIALSGFYKDPIFTWIEPENHQPVMLDDTCYFIGFSNKTEAAITFILLRDSKCKQFLLSLALLQSKRPFTKEHLSRIHLPFILSEYSFERMQQEWSHYFVEELTREDYDQYKEKVLVNTL